MKSRAKLCAIVFAVFSLLFMQLALASYVCPAGASAAAPAMVMPACEGMDMQQAALCHAHAQDHAQTLEKPDLPQVPAFIATSLIQAIVPLAFVSPPAAPARANQLAPAPQHTVLHCCFRI